MITYVVGDLFQSPAHVLVNTVNTVGVMGKGIAKQFKYIYPQMFEKYQALCERDLFNVGQLWLYKTPHKWILNFPTKKHWRSPSKPEYIELGLQKFVKTYAEKGISSVAFPQLGCGNGELDWQTQVKPLMEQYLNDIPIDIYVYLYKMGDRFLPEHRDLKAISHWLRGEPQSLSFDEFWHDLVQVIQRDEFETYEGLHFHIQQDTLYETSALTFITRDDSHTLPENVFLDLWQSIRRMGIVHPRDLPVDFQPISAMLIRLLTELDYIQAVHLSDSKTTQGLTIGLQIAPVLPVLQATAQTIKLA